jgi:tetratricopeptide (TPR) repeat protein
VRLVSAKLKLLLVTLCVAALMVAAATLVSQRLRTHAGSQPAAPGSAANTRETVAVYVGSDACRTCHPREYEDWRGSHHQLAMQAASDATVLGNFRDGRLTYFSVTSHFFKRDGRFFVNTDGPDGKLHDYEIKYAFGVYPLQQYLVPFSDGRLQALSIAWDARPREQGGQAWFHLYPTDHIRAGDELHWTGLQQNWNFMCAECHSTDLRKNYDAASNSYHTTWNDMSVGCEACHGAGSRHMHWAQNPRAATAAASAGDAGLLAQFDDRRAVVWVLDGNTGNSRRSRPRTNTNELEMCGRCHARGAKMAETWVPGQPLLDTHRVTLLVEGMYSADGQMQEEVYNYGSFVQSKMFAAGVTCSDCHEPHSQKLRAPGAQVCGLCHSPVRYASKQHHHHQQGTAESGCPACHMPVRTYMVIDRRHDHSFRIPRPEDSVSYGTPNACNDCHQDKTAAWALRAVQNWYGNGHPGYQQFTGQLSAARRQLPAAAAGLLALARDGTAPAIARATALTELTSYLDADALAAAREGLQSADALIRLAAVELLAGTDPTTRWQLLARALTDPVLAVRVAAADALADALPTDAPAEIKNAYERALAEYVATQKVNADRPEAHASLGHLYARQGKLQDAENEYQTAIRLEPGFVPAYVNLADLERAAGRDAEAENWLGAAAQTAPDNSAVVFALGLLRVRQHRTDAALQLLARASALSPEEPHYAYVYGVGLYSTGKTTQGLRVLSRAHERFPANRELRLGLASLSADAGDLQSARRYTERFIALAPSDPRGRQLLEQLPVAHEGPPAPAR